MTAKTAGRSCAVLPLAAVLACTWVSGGCSQPASGHPAAQATTTAARQPVASRSRPTKITYPAAGDNRWSGAAAEVPARPGRGRLLRYRVAVERAIHGLPVARFAAEVTRTLNDPHGWTAGGTRQLRRVAWDQSADFTIYLATPGTRDELCQDVPDGYTSCRNGDRVVLNVARWVKGVPGYGADLATYRRYMVNHEVGHRLGMGHELCPRPGRPAPVMQQQTLGLHGCTANAAPYRDGKRYAGPSGTYHDPIPPRDSR